MNFRNVIVLTVVALVFTATGIKVANDVHQANAADKAYNTAFGISDEIQPTRTQPTAVASASTAGQRNALSTAKSYLRSDAFSKSGLVDQLKYENFSRSDARWAVAHVRVSWYAEAVEAAKSYLRSDAFSRQGLVEQLEYEGFTHSQASRGVAKAYR